MLILFYRRVDNCIRWRQPGGRYCLCSATLGQKAKVFMSKMCGVCRDVRCPL